MSQENHALAAALINAKNVPPDITENIEELSRRLLMDLIEFNGQSYHTNPYTIAALLAFSSDFRKFAMDKGVDVVTFDAMIGALRREWQAHTNKQHPGGKLVAALRKDVPF